MIQIGRGSRGTSIFYQIGQVSCVGVAEAGIWRYMQQAFISHAISRMDIQRRTCGRNLRSCLGNATTNTSVKGLKSFCVMHIINRDCPTDVASWVAYTKCKTDSFLSEIDGGGGNKQQITLFLPPHLSLLKLTVLGIFWPTESLGLKHALVLWIQEVDLWTMGS